MEIAGIADSLAAGQTELGTDLHPSSGSKGVKSITHTVIQHH